MKEKQKKKKIIIMAVSIALISILMFFYPIFQPKIYNLLANSFSIVSSKNNLLVHFISVGQGDAAAINLPDGKVLLIDAGSSSSNVTFTTYLNEKVFNGKRNKKIDYFIMTHSDADHIGGALRLLKNFDVDTIYMPVITSDSNTYEELYSYIYSQNYNLISDNEATTIVQNDYKIEFFAPVSLTDSNDSCPVIRVEYMDYSFIFTGDISASAESKFVENYGELLDSDVLKVAHHGSKYSSSLEFLEVVSPQYAVISVGANSYGHPTNEAISNLNSVGASILRTDEDGNVIFTVGKYYDLMLKTGDYSVTNAIFDYRIIILVYDGILIFCIIKTIFTKSKRRHKDHNSENLDRWIHA